MLFIKAREQAELGKGRYAFDDYPDAAIHNIDIKDKAVGDRCLSCHKGKLYNSEARKLLHFTGDSPINVERYKKAVLRCNSCGIEFMNHQPVHKWDDTARSSIVWQRIYGMPFYRLAKLQSLYNTPIAESTLWIQCLNLWDDCGYYIYQQLLAVAGGSKIFIQMTPVLKSLK